MVRERKKKTKIIGVEKEKIMDLPFLYFSLSNYILKMSNFYQKYYMYSNLRLILKDILKYSLIISWEKSGIHSQPIGRVILPQKSRLIHHPP